MMNEWEPGGLLLEAWSELHAVTVQTYPSDDHFIMLRVHAAFALLDAARLKAIKEESMYRGEDRFHCERTDEDPRGDPPEPVRDDWPEPDYLALAVRNARAQAAAVANPVTAAELHAADRAAQEQVAHE